MIKTIIILILLVAAAGALYSSPIKTIEKRINIKKASDIFVYATASRINIVTENRDDIAVKLDTSKYGPRLYISEGKELRIESKKKGFSKLFFIHRPSVLTVYIPREYSRELTVQSISGSIEAADMSIDKLSFKSTSGRIRLQDIKSEDLTVKSTSGSITLQDIKSENLTVKSTSGSLDLTFINSDNGIISTTSGSIDLSESSIKSLEINSVSGSITASNFDGGVRGGTTSGRIRINMNSIVSDVILNSTSGSIKIGVISKELNSQVKLKSISGSVSCDFPVTVVGKVSRKSLDGVSGVKDHLIDISTVSGSISIYPQD